MTKPDKPLNAYDTLMAFYPENEFMNNTSDCAKCTPTTESSSYINVTYQLKMEHTAMYGLCRNCQILMIDSHNLQYRVSTEGWLFLCLFMI